MQHNAYSEHNRMKRANLKADLDELRENGMNVGLMYGGSGAGGQTIVSSGISGGNPIPMSGEGLSRGTAMGIEMANINADLDLKAAQAEALRAEAANKRANTETEDKSRDIFIENMKQSGVSTWLENIVKKVRLQGVPEENEVSSYRDWERSI